MSTLSEIAKLAGVSKMTVSNVLNGRSKEAWPSSAERANQIRQIAERLQYRPNAAAKAIAQGRFNNVAMVMGQTAQYMPDGLLRGAAQALAERDMSLTITELPDAKLTNQGFVPKMLRELSSDGLLINYISNVPEAMERLLRSNHIPSAWINIKGPTDCVYPDDEAGARAATEHLLQLGHRRIAFVGGTGEGHYSDADRRGGYEATMRAAGRRPQVVAATTAAWRKDMTPASTDTRLSACAALLASADRPTAVLAAEPDYAQPLMYAAALAGLAVPRDLSVITFADWVPDGLGVFCGFMHISMTKVGATAVRLLAEKLENPAVTLPSVAVPLTLHVGQTVAPPRDR
jgi:DNA-binding LacI/PurR family transcriptional regulator